MRIKKELIENTEYSFSYIEDKLDTLSKLIGGNEKLDQVRKNLQTSESDFHYLISSFLDYAGLVESLSILFSKIITMHQQDVKPLIPQLAKFLQDLKDYQDKLFEEGGDCETHD